ncbi:DUF5812 family protein [Halomarina ordinaria]|uniref:DUF5812 family protein n=1 Tax=Halomarina ordinaria TaxID=3033939 RepID=A0ABD5UBR0_9EURY|nr:DUF5812 family protein [Halomarina sp. PSRA2]
MTDEPEATGTYLVTHAEDDSAVLNDVDSGRVHPLAENPGVEERDVLEATLAPEPPMEVTWRVVEVEARRSLSLERSEEPPTAQERAIASEQSVGDLTREERAGVGELHVLTVDPDDTSAAVDDVLADEGTLVRAARLGVDRVEVRAADDVVSVRYLP